MSTDNTANHRHKWGVAGNDPNYPKQSYYADREREAQELKEAREFWLRYWDREEAAQSHLKE